MQYLVCGLASRSKRRSALCKPCLQSKITFALQLNTQIFAFRSGITLDKHKGTPKHVDNKSDKDNTWLIRMINSYPYFCPNQSFNPHLLVTKIQTRYRLKFQI